MYSTRYYKMANKLNQGSTDQYIAQGVNALAGLFKQPNPQELLARQQLETGRQKAGMLNTVMDYAKTLSPRDQADLLSALYTGKAYADTDLAQSTRKLMDVLNPNQTRYVPENLRSQFDGKDVLGGNIVLKPNEAVTVSPEMQKAFDLSSPNLFGVSTVKKGETIYNPDGSVLTGVTTVNRGQNAVMPDGSVIEGQTIPEKMSKKQQAENSDNSFTAQSLLMPNNAASVNNAPVNVPPLDDLNVGIEASIKNPAQFAALSPEAQKTVNDAGLLFKKLKQFENFMDQNKKIESPLNVANFALSNMVGSMGGQDGSAWATTQSEYRQLLKEISDLSTFMNGTEAAKLLKPMSNTDIQMVKNAYNQISSEKPPQENLKHVQTVLRTLSNSNNGLNQFFNISPASNQQQNNPQGLQKKNFGGAEYEFRDGRFYPVTRQ